ncbi:hypothetical protein [Streptodolium elevatio]|uniref:Uncharacterized protein n=1 Tax=Streptodolium elevatio TaxID=3157996 RepID=A0ABV3DTE7_9ACTN
MTHVDRPPQPPPYADDDPIARAIAGLQADTSNGGLIARFGDRMAARYQAVQAASRAAAQAAEEHAAGTPGAET